MHRDCATNGSAARSSAARAPSLRSGDFVLSFFLFFARLWPPMQGTGRSGRARRHSERRRIVRRQLVPCATWDGGTVGRRQTPNRRVTRGAGGTTRTPRTQIGGMWNRDCADSRDYVNPALNTQTARDRDGGVIAVFCHSSTYQEVTLNLPCDHFEPVWQMLNECETAATRVTGEFALASAGVRPPAESYVNSLTISTRPGMPVSRS